MCDITTQYPIMSQLHLVAYTHVLQTLLHSQTLSRCLHLKIVRACETSQLNISLFDDEYCPRNQLQMAPGEETFEQVQHDKTLSTCVWVQPICIGEHKPSHLNLHKQCNDIENIHTID